MIHWPIDKVVINSFIVIPKYLKIVKKWTKERTELIVDSDFNRSQGWNK